MALAGPASSSRLAEAFVLARPVLPALGPPPSTSPYQAEAPGRARVAARCGLLCVASDLPGSSFLEITAVGLACLTGYKSRLTALLQWSSTRRLHWSSNNELDTVLVSYFDKMYFEGFSSADGSKTLAAIKHFKPEVGRHGPLSLARSERCIKSWIRSAPRHQRVPLTFVVLAAILVYLVYHPGTCDLLRVAQLLPPAPEAGPQYAQWELLDRAQGCGQDGTLGPGSCLGHGPLGRRHLCRPHKGAPRGRGTLAAETAEAFREACLALGLEALKPCRYGLRHGGASEDILTKTRTIEAAKKRGHIPNTISIGV